jgi:2'-5' RNA ligase
MTDAWRLFVAVPLADEVRTPLAAAVRDWAVRPDLAGLRWTDPDAWHLTLAFLGSTPSTDLGRVTEAVAAVAARHEPFEAQTGGLGAFPSKGRARVVWYGVADLGGRVGALAADLQAALDIEVGAAFRPHITLARARRDPVDARPWLEGAGAPEGVMSFDRVHLLRSHLGCGPARYEAVASAALAEPTRV